MGLLESSIMIGDVEVSNRLVMPPMATKFAGEDREVTDKLIKYYRKRADGGAGMVIVEATNVAPEGRFIEKMLEINDDSSIQGLWRLSSAIKDGGAKAFIQLAHGGSRSRESFNQGYEVVSPSSVPFVDDLVPTPLSGEGIAEIVESFTNAALRAVKAGYDGVEVHAAHMYLLSQFLSPSTNKRTDEYGTVRTRIVEEIIHGIKKKAGSDFPVICRINGYEDMPEGLTNEDAKKHAIALEKSGVDALHVSGYLAPEKGYSGKAFKNLESHAGDGYLVTYAAGVKSVVNVPVITVGRIRDIGLAERIIEDGSADMVAVGRGYIADAGIARKWLEGRPEEVTTCTVCGRCAKDLMEGPHITCPVNPALGTEDE